LIKIKNLQKIDRNQYEKEKFSAEAMKPNLYSIFITLKL